MYKLYIDESGTNKLSNINALDPNFCVAGVLVNVNGTNGAADFLRNRGDQIRFKYWGHKSETVLHANPIRRNTGDFSIFGGDLALQTEFHEDLRQYVQSAGFKFIWIGVNKLNWINLNPPIAHAVTNNFSLTKYEKTLTQLLFSELIETYLLYLIHKDFHGQIIVEACSQTQDQDLLEVYNRFMFSGSYTNGWSPSDVRDRLTCISFVTKKNADPETQLADLGALFLNIDSRVQDNIGYNNVSTFDTEMMRIFRNKAYNFRTTAGTRVNSIKRLA
jgi:hypothetical protein